MQNSQPTVSQPLEIGPVRARNRVFLAPLSGISDLPFRQLAWRYGAGLVVTEMVASRELVTDAANRKCVCAAMALIRMWFSWPAAKPDWMAKAAKIAEGEGAAMIDINMGCPAKKVTGGYSGSALMRDPDHALESDRSHRQGRLCAGHIENAAWLGP
jgi:tRNA-dihydrouridine synthase B